MQITVIFHALVFTHSLSVWRHKPAPYFSFFIHETPPTALYIATTLQLSQHTTHGRRCEIAQPTFMNEIRGKKCVCFSPSYKSAARVPRVSLIGVITQDYQLVERERDFTADSMQANAAHSPNCGRRVDSMPSVKAFPLIKKLFSFDIPFHPKKEKET